MLRAECVFSAVCNMGFPYAYLMRPISLPENRRAHAGSNSAIAMQQHIDAIRTAQNICFFIRVSNDVEIKRLAFLRCVAFLAYRQIAVFAGVAENLRFIYGDGSRRFRTAVAASRPIAPAIRIAHAARRSLIGRSRRYAPV
ncbi:TPA: hypothetical protein QDA96_002576 [Burkholderia vietnamiensis]|uniref:hypothetical protein n=1 Tax=Burkholderia vietnamiensis TaxID=60552 RepID=UPI001590CA01|nr:hypothetical protein [Burkholderia vietnamiensis]HDR9009060.1 hypothetical protein [Burkholderia vietnamiensis]HDR9016462.1 hypothetical protein [Burkholderia vietnamiensis]HDR9041907.1 hypothetical protein [Burkholderia vietnamiensis]HDR9255214.1 hypothetical protein [Burkholderia vietnamiensis]